MPALIVATGLITYGAIAYFLWTIIAFSILVLMGMLGLFPIPHIPKPPDSHLAHIRRRILITVLLYFAIIGPIVYFGSH